MDKKTKTIKVVMLIIFFAVMGLATYLLIPLIKVLRSKDGISLIVQRVESYGAYSWLMFIGLQVIQIVVAIIPGEPVEIIGGILFGAFGGFVLCMIGIVIGTVTVYYLVKWIGKPLVSAVVDYKKLEKYKILNDTRRLELLIFVLFFVPGTPKDGLTYIAPLTKIKAARFFLYVFIARIPSVLSSTFVGANIGDGNWALSIIIFALTAAIGLVGIFYNEKIISKAKEIKKALHHDEK
ncbi:MAG: VTT domain-containing protein [Oscillospiraceae bacterium]|jgi:uncharacterized membrane protein YdjX (TVP38/TMEM64 family)